ncbi:unnamed protein product, partial [Porites lobata]
MRFNFSRFNLSREIFQYVQKTERPTVEIHCKQKKAGSASDKEIEVQINIGLMVWSDKNVCIKPKRGKRLALRVSNKATYKVILQKAVEKWRAFNSDLYDENEDYILLLENGEEAQFLPG